MGSIAKKGEGKYLLRISRGTEPHRTFLNKMFRGTLKEARAELRKQESLLDSGQSVQAVKLNFEEYRKLWLRAIKPKISDRTYEDYDEYLRRYCQALNSVALFEVRAHHVQQIYDQMLADDFSPTTVRKLHAVLRAAFGYAVKKEYLTKNPILSVDVPAKANRELQVLDRAEAKLFSDKCTEMPNGLIFHFALSTGMRPEEYQALQWRDIDFARNKVSVQRVVVFARKGGGYKFAKCKTKASRRMVPISADLRDKLMVHRREQNEQILASRVSYNTQDLVFANSVGNPHSLKNLSDRYFRPILKACGFAKHLTLYSLRHSTATLLLSAGENPKVVAERLGHTSVVLTLDTYSHVLPGIQEEATAKLDNILRFG